jgi:hypothetical protein
LDVAVCNADKKILVMANFRVDTVSGSVVKCRCHQKRGFVMVHRIKAIVATDRLGLEGVRFSIDALRSITEQVDGQPVLMDFDHSRVIGKAISAIYNESTRTIIVTADVSDTSASVPQYLVPAGTVACEDICVDTGLRTINDMRLFSFGLTTSPADKALLPIQKGGSR